MIFNFAFPTRETFLSLSQQVSSVAQGVSSVAKRISSVAKEIGSQGHELIVRSDSLSGGILNVWTDLAEKADILSDLDLDEKNIISYYDRVICEIQAQSPIEIETTEEIDSMPIENLQHKKQTIIKLISKKARQQLEGQNPEALTLVNKLEKIALDSSGTNLLGNIQALKSLIEINSELDKLGPQAVGKHIKSQLTILERLTQERTQLSLLDLHNKTLLIRHFYALSPCRNQEKEMEELLKSQIESWIPDSNTNEAHQELKRALLERDPNIKEICIRFEQATKIAIKEQQGTSFEGLEGVKTLALRKSSKKDIEALQKRFAQNRSMHYSFSLVFDYFLKSSKEERKDIYEKIQIELGKVPEDNRMSKFKELAYQQIDALSISSTWKKVAKWYLSCSLFVQNKLFTSLIETIIEEFDKEIQQKKQLTNKEITKLTSAINQTSTESLDQIKKDVEKKVFVYQNKILKKHLRFKPVRHLLIRPAKWLLGYVEESAIGHKLKALTPRFAVRFWTSRRVKQVKSGIIAGGKLLSQVIDRPCNMIIQCIVKRILTQTKLIPNTLDSLFESLSEEDFLSSKLDNLLIKQLDALETKLLEDSSFRSQSSTDNISRSILSIWNDLESKDTSVLPVFSLSKSYTNVDPSVLINYYDEVIGQFNALGLTVGPIPPFSNDAEELKVKKRTIIEFFYRGAQQKLTEQDPQDIEKVTRLKEEALRKSAGNHLGDIEELQQLITFKSKLDIAYKDLVKASTKFLLKTDHLIEFSPIQPTGIMDADYIEREWIAPKVKEAASTFLESLEQEENRRQLIYTVLENLVDPEQQFPTDEMKEAEKTARESVKARVEAKLAGDLIPRAAAHYTSESVAPRTSSPAKCIEFLAQHFPNEVQFDQEHKQPSMPNAQTKTEDLSKKFVLSDDTTFDSISLSGKRELFCGWKSEFETFIFQLDEHLTIMKDKHSSKDPCLHIKTFDSLASQLTPYLTSISNELNVLILDPNNETQEHVQKIFNQFELIKGKLKKESLSLNAIHFAESQPHSLRIATSNVPSKTVERIVRIGLINNPWLEPLCQKIAGRALLTIHETRPARVLLQNVTATVLAST